MRSLQEDYLIKVEGSQEADGVCDTVSLVTRGDFIQRDHAYYIIYKETEATGSAGCTTTVRIKDDSQQVSMLRFGSAPSQLVLEKGVRHICHYETGHGALSLGLSADEIICELSNEGGQLYFSYLLDVGEESYSRNTVHITVRKA